MTQHLSSNPKLSIKIQSDTPLTNDGHKFLMNHARKSTVTPSVGNTTSDEANKENVQNYNPQVG